ncbi:hypothetical protein J8273_0127 [Carpediemonas membranifera]|uniref:Uncharacterized protein n=1 Tax=Carpediemonas membranifera TaxID=201153 RepID=A0A8J6B7T1_9EUKA|nr:hypothetical protein J8273_0127 [Carpediemonas membranifera]|eukprot:KAG9394919.1 hypothetical protein J8273_0127 [Carpediemonas membranifera]
MNLLSISTATIADPTTTAILTNGKFRVDRVVFDVNAIISELNLTLLSKLCTEANAAMNTIATFEGLTLGDEASDSGWQVCCGPARASRQSWDDTMQHYQPAGPLVAGT